MIKANVGTIVQFRYGGQLYKRELAGFIEIDSDFWVGDIGWKDEDDPVPGTSFLIFGHTSNGVPVWHDLKIRVDEPDATFTITEGIVVRR